jgi:TolB-like protein
MIRERDVREHLEKILASEGFVNSERLCRFMRFTVEAKLRNEAGQLKEYLVGREVFDRKEEYDPRLDPIVRVEARRLRKRLQEYYDGPGSADPLRIELPRGGYAPEIQEAGKASRRFPRRLIGVAAGVAAVSAVYFGWNVFADPGLAVVPASWPWKADGSRGNLDEDLAERLAAELANRKVAAVVPWPSVQKFRHEATSTEQAARVLGVRRVMMVTVRGDESDARVTLFLLDAKTDRKIWVGDFPGRDLRTAEGAGEMARAAVDAFAAAGAGR